MFLAPPPHPLQGVKMFRWCRGQGLHLGSPHGMTSGLDALYKHRPGLDPRTALMSDENPLTPQQPVTSQIEIWSCRCGGLWDKVIQVTKLSDARHKAIPA